MPFVILADRREPAVIVSALRTQTGLVRGKVEIVELPFDYLVAGKMTVAVERKSRMDLLGSLADGRLDTQAKAMNERAQISIVACTGHLTCRDDRVYLNGEETRWNYWAVQGKLHSLNAAGVHIREVSDWDFPQWLAMLGVWASKEQHLVPRRQHLPFEALDPRIAVLAGFKSIGEKTALMILEHFGSLGTALANVDRWEEVKGIGPRTSEAVKEMLG